MGIINDHPWAFRSTRGYLFSDRTADSHPDGGEYSRQERSYDPLAGYARKFPTTAQPTDSADVGIGASIGTEERTKALGISAWHMSNGRKQYGCPMVTLPRGNGAFAQA